MKFSLPQSASLTAPPEEEPIITFAASVSLRLGHATALTVHRTVIHYRVDTSLLHGRNPRSMIISAEILSAFPSIGSFSLDLQKFSKAIFLYAKRALGYTTKKEANHLTRDFLLDSQNTLKLRYSETCF